jgi:hypothetical protein
MVRAFHSSITGLGCVLPVLIRSDLSVPACSAFVPLGTGLFGFRPGENRLG